MNSLTKIIVFALVTLLFGCRNKIKQENNFALENFNIENILQHANCGDYIDSFGLLTSAIDELISEAKKNKTKNLERILLIFYLEEGDVIKNYQSCLFITNDDTSHSMTFLNQSKKPTSVMSIDNFKVNKFYDYLSKIREGELIENSLLIFDFNKSTVDCKYFDSVRKSARDEIKTLAFIKNL